MRRVVPYFLLVILFGAGIAVRGQQGPEKTLAQLKPAPGLEATMFASEPMITNPTDLTVDERGRVWVLEGQNYRLRSKNLPDNRPEGDRIVILEDTNNDGKADTSKVFDQDPGLRVPLGIAVLGDKVYVSHSPDLIVYTKDKNDKILKKEALLTGFNGFDHDHGLHALVFAWDGKFYFNHGNVGFDVTDKSGTRLFMEQPPSAGRGQGQGQGQGQGRGQAQGQGRGSSPNTPTPATPPTGPGYYQGVVMRINPDGTGLEVIAQNFRNPYEVTVDSWGNVTQTDNDDDGTAWTRFVYVMEGGNYGYRGPLNRAWREDHGTEWHEEVPGVAPTLFRIGAGSPSGVLAYEGTLLPPKYRGQVFHADSGPRRVEMYPMEERGAGFEARREDVFSTGEDTWARPVDVAAAPDGSLYIPDWYDPGVGGHLMGDAKGALGRIYRVAPTGHRPQVPTLDLSSTAGLTAALASPNQSTQFLAYNATKAKGQAAVPMLQAMWKQTDPILRARALWLLGRLGQAGSTAIREAMQSNDPRVRVLGLRVARSTGANMLAFSKPFLRDSSPAVRREIALMLQDPSTMRPPYLFPAQKPASSDLIDALAVLASQYDGQDRWYLEAIGIAARGREDALYAKLKQDTGARNVLGKLVWVMRPKSALPDLIATINSASASAEARTVALDALGNMQWPEATGAVESFILAAATPAPLAAHAFKLYSHQLFSLWTSARTSPAMVQVIRKAFTLPDAQASAATLAADLNDARFLPDLATFAKSASADPAARAAAVDAVSRMKGADYVADFEALGESGPLPVRMAAIRALQFEAAAPGVVAYAQRILLSDAPNEVRAEALRVLANSADGLNAILDLASNGTLPGEMRSIASSLTNNASPATGRRGPITSPVAIRQQGAAPTDPAYIAIRERAATILPLRAARPIPTSFDIDLSYAGRIDEGKKLYDTSAFCLPCHTVGGGKSLGPDLTHIGSKLGKQAMLDAIVNPNEGIQFEYVPTAFTMKNGDQVTGTIAEERPDEIVVQIGPNQQQRIKPSDVASRKEIRISQMPEGLLNNLSLQQIADLLAYLDSLK